MKKNFIKRNNLPATIIILTAIIKTTTMVMMIAIIIKITIIIIINKLYKFLGYEQAKKIDVKRVM